MEKACGKDVAYEENPAAVYAAVRNGLYDQAGKKIEIMVNYQPKLHFISEWWKQLFGESEGKDNKYIPCFMRLHDRPSLYGTVDSAGRTLNIRNCYQR